MSLLLTSTRETRLKRLQIVQRNIFFQLCLTEERMEVPRPTHFNLILTELHKHKLVISYLIIFIFHNMADNSELWL